MFAVQEFLGIKYEDNNAQAKKENKQKPDPKDEALHEETLRILEVVNFFQMNFKSL